jgi:hypothetical protein
MSHPCPFFSPFFFIYYDKIRKKQEGSSVCVSNYKQNRNKKVSDGTRSTWNGHKVYFSVLAGRYTHIEREMYSSRWMEHFIYLLFFFFWFFFHVVRTGINHVESRPCIHTTEKKKRGGPWHGTVSSLPPFFLCCCLVCPTKAHCVCTHTKTYMYTLLCYISLTASARSRFNGFSSPKLLWRWPIERYIGSCTTKSK